MRRACPPPPDIKYYLCNDGAHALRRTSTCRGGHRGFGSSQGRMRASSDGSLAFRRHDAALPSRDPATLAAFEISRQLGRNTISSSTGDPPAASAETEIEARGKRHAQDHARTYASVSASPNTRREAQGKTFGPRLAHPTSASRDAGLPHLQSAGCRTPALVRVPFKPRMQPGGCPTAKLTYTQNIRSTCPDLGALTAASMLRCIPLRAKRVQRRTPCSMSPAPTHASSQRSGAQLSESSYWLVAVPEHGGKSWSGVNLSTISSSREDATYPATFFTTIAADQRKKFQGLARLLRWTQSRS